MSISYDAVRSKEEIMDQQMKISKQDVYNIKAGFWKYMNGHMGKSDVIDNPTYVLLDIEQSKIQEFDSNILNARIKFYKLTSNPKLLTISFKIKDKDEIDFFKLVDAIREYFNNSYLFKGKKLRCNFGYKYNNWMRFDIYQ
jgi:hypothetical protein